MDPIKPVSVCSACRGGGGGGVEHELSEPTGAEGGRRTDAHTYRGTAVAMPDETNNDTEDGRTHSPTDGQGKLMGGDGTGRERVHYIVR